MLRWVFPVLTAVCLCFSCAAMADGMKTIHIAEEQVSLAIPEEYITASRQDSELDSRFTEQGFTLQSIHQWMLESDIWLYAIMPDNSSTLNLVITDLSDDLQGFPSDVLKIEDFESLIVEEYESLGITARTDIRQLEKLSALQVRIDSLQNSDQATLQYAVIAEGKIFVLTLAKTGPVTDEDEAMMESILNQSDFSAPEPAGETGPNFYINPENGIRFIIPEGWKQEKLSKEYPVNKIQIINENTFTLETITYGHVDIYQIMLNEDPEIADLYTRQNIDTLIGEPLPELFADGPMEVMETQRHSGLDFTMVTYQETNELNMEVKTLGAMTMKDGYALIFGLSYFGDPDYDVFYQILDSITFEDVDSSAASANRQAEEQPAETADCYDETFGVHFTIPEGWEKRNLTSNIKNTRMKISPRTEDYAVSISYGQKNAAGVLSDIMDNYLEWMRSNNPDQFITPEIIRDVFVSMYDVEASQVDIQERAGGVFAVGEIALPGFGDKLAMKVALTVRSKSIFVFCSYGPEKCIS